MFGERASGRKAVAAIGKEAFAPVGLVDLFGARGDRRVLARRACLHREGDPMHSVYYVASGWLSRIRFGPAGTESFMGVHIAGDFIGLDALPDGRLADEFTALSACVIQRVSSDELLRALLTNPALAAEVMRLLAVDAGLLREALFAVGTQSSVQRLATFLLQTHARLVASGEIAADAQQWDLPLTQAQLAGVLGLTSVHVNRVLRTLKLQDLFDLRGGMVRRFDREGLLQATYQRH